MNLFESTAESPLGFLNSYLKYDGKEYLREKFESFYGYDYFYDPKKDCLTALDLQTNKIEYELSFPEFVISEFVKQTKITKGLIFQRSKQNSDGQDLKLYKSILIGCLNIQKHIDLLTELNFKPTINKYLSDILTFVYKNFNEQHRNEPVLMRVKNYYSKRNKRYNTGFRLKEQIRNKPLSVFFHVLKEEKFISKKSNFLEVLQFLGGALPTQKIIWEKELNELHYFIVFLCDPSILEKVPGWKWKIQDQIFSWHGNDLPDSWYRNNNKLKNRDKVKAIKNLVNMLRPKYS